MKIEERDSLMDALLDGEISEADFLRLEAEMHVDPAARLAYYERLKLDTALQVEAESVNEKNSSSQAVSSSTKFKAGWLGWAAAGVLALLVCVLAVEIRRTNLAIAQPNQETIASGFGVVAEQSQATWKLNRGDLLPQETLVLKSGMVELELFSGVTVIVEGDAEFSILSANKAEVKRGKIGVRVPRLVDNFQIATKSGEVYQVEDELALEVDPDGNATVLTSVDELGSRIESLLTDRHSAWLASTKRFGRDSRLLAYFPMNQSKDWRGQLIDESQHKQNGTIIRANRATNRWGEAFGGLDFTPTGSRVRVDIPGEHESITLMCWAKIDSLDRWYNSLFLTDGHELHEPHWQIMNDGRLFFSVKANSVATKKIPDKHIAYSPPIWTPKDSGKWMHIATVFDGKAMTTTHYLNGEAISKDQIPDELKPKKVQIGAASIGNWSDPTRGDDPNFAVRNLNGMIDEFAILTEPLTAKEIRDLYEIGKP